MASAGADPAGCRRELTASERVFLYFEREGSVKWLLTVARVEPAVAAAALQEAASAVQRRHPMLRAQLRFIGGEPFFDFAGRAPDIQVSEYTGSLDEAVEGELRDGQDPWRLALCGEHLLLTYHHAFLDGRSTVTMLRELLSLVDGVELAAVENKLPVEPKVHRAAPDPKLLFPDFKALLPEARTPLVGRWVPVRHEAWSDEAKATDPRTRHEWTEQHTCRYSCGSCTGSARLLGRTTGRSGAVYSAETVDDASGDRLYGTITVLRDGTVYHAFGPANESYYRRESPRSCCDGCLGVLRGSGAGFRGAGPRRGCFAACSKAFPRRPAARQQRAPAHPPRAPVPARVEPPCLARGAGGRAVSSWRQLTPEQTGRLLQRCREEGTTITGVLGAALARALRERGGPAMVGVASGVQSRREHEVGSEAVGCFVSTFGLPLRTDAPLWDVARDYYTQLTAAVHTKEHMRAIAAMPPWSALPPPGGPREQGPPPEWPAVCVGVSNRGDCTLRTPRRSVASIHTYMAGSPGPGDHPWLYAGTVNGRLCLSLQCHSGWSWSGTWACSDLADGIILALQL